MNVNFNECAVIRGFITKGYISDGPRIGPSTSPGREDADTLNERNDHSGHLFYTKSTIRDMVRLGRRVAR